ARSRKTFSARVRRPMWIPVLVRRGEWGVLPRDVASGELQDEADGAGDARPPLGLLGEPLVSGGREGVEARAPPGVGRPPGGGEEIVLLHAVERRVERSLLDAKLVAGDALDVARDGVAVEGPVAKRAEGQEL